MGLENRVDRFMKYLVITVAAALVPTIIALNGQYKARSQSLSNMQIENVQGSRKDSSYITQNLPLLVKHQEEALGITHSIIPELEFISQDSLLGQGGEANFDPNKN